MRDRRTIPDGPNLDACRRQSSYRGFAACPGPLTQTSTVRNPDSFALFAAVSDACCAAKGVPLRDPRNPSEPELDHAITLPMGSVMVMMVLLKDACTCTRPIGTERFSFFLKAFFFRSSPPVFLLAFPPVSPLLLPSI